MASSQHRGGKASTCRLRIGLFGDAHRVPPGIRGCLPPGVLQIHTTFSIAFPKQPLPPSDALTQAWSSTARLGGWIWPPQDFPPPSPSRQEQGYDFSTLACSRQQLSWWCWPRAGHAADAGEGSLQQPENSQGEHPASPCEELLGSTGHGAAAAPGGDAGKLEALTSLLLQQPQTGVLLPAGIQLTPLLYGQPSAQTGLGRKGCHADDLQLSAN